MVNRKSMAREYSQHIVERLELLKIIDIVRKIESENRYIEKMGKIDLVRNKKNDIQDEFVGIRKEKQGKWLSKTLFNKQF